MARYIINEIHDENKTCCICGAKITGWGNNPWPVKTTGECCDKCNLEKVIPARIEKLYSKTDTTTKDMSLEELSEEEKKAIEDYKKAIAGTTNPKLLDLFAHILKEETEHLQELQIAKNTIKDSPIGFNPKVENRQIISWRNTQTPKSLNEELDRYNTVDAEGQNILRGRILNHVAEVAEDYRYDKTRVDEASLNSHYKRYNDVIGKINTTLNADIKPF